MYLESRRLVVDCCFKSPEMPIYYLSGIGLEFQSKDSMLADKLLICFLVLFWVLIERNDICDLT